MKNKYFCFILILMVINAPLLNSQTTVIKVWPAGVPGSIKNDSYSEKMTMNNGLPQSFDKVTDPTITVSLPPKDKASGTAVLVCPGGGYAGLAFDHEGNQIAKWLNDNGIAAFILKYRLPSDLIMKDKSVGPLSDAQEAIRIIRRNASGWNVNPRKIGVIGFSAGGHLASTLSTHFAEKVYEVADTVSARPDFSILMYPVITMDASFTHAGSRKNLIGENPADEAVRRFSNELQVTPSTPPTFIVHSMNDVTVPVKNSIVYYEALIKNKVPSELHIFQKGGHGYGLAINRETQMAWPELCLRWMKVSGF